MKNNVETVQLQEFLIINSPAFSFLLFIPAGLFTYSLFHSQFRYAGIPFVIWGVSGCVLLLIDYYKRKKALFLRLLRLNQNRDPLKHSIYLKSTVCGLAILWALYVRKNSCSIRGDSL